MDATWPLTGTVDAGMWVCVVKRKGGIQENPGFWVFAAAPVQPPGSRLFTLKKLCRRQPDLSSLNRSFVMLLPCYKTFSVFYSENVNF